MTFWHAWRTCLLRLKAPDASCVVLDGAAIIQMRKPAGAKTFDEYAQQVFIPYISSQLRSVSRVDLVWDTWQEWLPERNSKSQAWKGCKEMCGLEGCHTRKLAELSVGWQTELFCFLSKVLLQAFCEEDKEVVLVLPVYPALTRKEGSIVNREVTDRTDTCTTDADK